MAISAVAAMEQVLAQTLAYVKERKAFGQARVRLPEHALQARRGSRPRRHSVACSSSVHRALARAELDATTAAMAKYWTPRSSSSRRSVPAAARRLRLHERIPHLPMWRDSRVQRIYGGTNEIMKELIGRSL